MRMFYLLPLVLVLAVAPAAATTFEFEGHTTAPVYLRNTSTLELMYVVLPATDFSGYLSYPEMAKDMQFPIEFRIDAAGQYLASVPGQTLGIKTEEYVGTGWGPLEGTTPVLQGNMFLGRYGQIPAILFYITNDHLNALEMNFFEEFAFQRQNIMPWVIDKSWSVGNGNGGNGTPNPVPEPSVAIMVLVGLTAIATARKLS